MSEGLILRAFGAPSAIFLRCGAHFGLDLHRRNCGCEVSYAHQIVSCADEGEDPIHLADATMPQLPHQRNRLQPAETFFDSLPLSLADDVAGVPRRAPIDRAAARPFVVLRHMRRHPHIPALGHKPLGVKSLVSPHGHRTAFLATSPTSPARRHVLPFP